MQACFGDFGLRNIYQRSFRDQNGIIHHKTETLPLSHWHMGRITETHSGIDGVMQTVKVKTPSNELVERAQNFAHERN